MKTTKNKAGEIEGYKNRRDDRYEEGKKDAKLQALQEAVEIGEKLKKKLTDEARTIEEIQNATIKNQAISDFQGRLKEKIEEEK